MTRSYCDVAEFSSCRCISAERAACSSTFEFDGLIAHRRRHEVTLPYPSAFIRKRKDNNDRFGITLKEEKMRLRQLYDTPS